MEQLNYWLAWISTLMLVFLSMIYPTRLYIQKYKLSKMHWLQMTNRFLRKVHKSLGIAMVGVVFLHCKFSTQKLGINTGTICLIFAILLMLTYILKNQLKVWWMRLHRSLTIALWGLLITHVMLTRLTNIL